MCDVGFCIFKLVNPDHDQALPCTQPCNINSKINVVDELEKVKFKTEGLMFDGITIKGKRKQ